MSGRAAPDLSLRLYNTMTGAKAPVRPRTPGHVGMYVCGVTVYDLCHIGHARSAIVFDVLRRYLESKGLIVTYVRNFTDIDDKIIARPPRRPRAGCGRLRRAAPVSGVQGPDRHLRPQLPRHRRQDHRARRAGRDRLARGGPTGHPRIKTRT